MAYGKQCLTCKKLETIVIGSSPSRQVCDSEPLWCLDYYPAKRLEALLFRAANEEQCPLYEEKTT